MSVSSGLEMHSNGAKNDSNPAEFKVMKPKLISEETEEIKVL